MRIDTDYAGVLFISSMVAIGFGYTALATYLILAAMFLVIFDDPGKLFHVSLQRGA